MKKNYLDLEIDVILFLQNDVLTESSDADYTSDPYKPGSNEW